MNLRMQSAWREYVWNLWIFACLFIAAIALFVFQEFKGSAIAGVLAAFFAFHAGHAMARTTRD